MTTYGYQSVVNFTTDSEAYELLTDVKMANYNA